MRIQPEKISPFFPTSDMKPDRQLTEGSMKKKDYNRNACKREREEKERTKKKKNCDLTFMQSRKSERKRK